MGFLSPAESLAMAQEPWPWGVPLVLTGCLAAVIFVFSVIFAASSDGPKTPQERKNGARLALAALFLGPVVALYWPVLFVIGGVAGLIWLVRTAVKG